MRNTIVAILLALMGCMPGGWASRCKVYDVPDRAQPCDHECAMAVTRGIYPNEDVMKKAYFTCLASCPGVTITRGPCR